MTSDIIKIKNPLALINYYESRVQLPPRKEAGDI
jgi:hypothetical protein